MAQAYGQAGVFISLVHQGAVDKAVALDPAHGGQHARVAQALARELLHHALAHGHGIHAQALGQVRAGQRFGLGSAHAAVHARRERGPLLHAGFRLPGVAKMAAVCDQASRLRWSVRSILSGVIDIWPSVVA